MGQDGVSPGEGAACGVEPRELVRQRAFRKSQQPPRCFCQAQLSQSHWAWAQASALGSAARAWESAFPPSGPEGSIGSADWEMPLPLPVSHPPASCLRCCPRRGSPSEAPGAAPAPHTHPGPPLLSLLPAQPQGDLLLCRAGTELAPGSGSRSRLLVCRDLTTGSALGPLHLGAEGAPGLACADSG